jgi:hypothetical protein
MSRTRKPFAFRSMIVRSLIALDTGLVRDMRSLHILGEQFVVRHSWKAGRFQRFEIAPHRAGVFRIIFRDVVDKLLGVRPGEPSSCRNK